MTSLSYLVRRTFSAAATTSPSASGTDAAIIKSFCRDLYRCGQSYGRLVEKFKNACENETFRNKANIYKETVRRLAAANNLHYVEEILEDQKKYKNMSREGFNARLISLYGSSGMYDNARKVFDEMRERNCARTVLSFNALLGACVNSKKFDVVDGLFRGLSKELEIEPDLVSYNTVIKAFCEMGSLDSAASLLDEMEKKGLEPDLITFNTILHWFYLKGRFVDAERIWGRMIEKDVKPNTWTYNTKLLGLSFEKKMKDAAEIVEEMKSKGIELDSFSFNALIRGSVNEENLKEARVWYREMGKNNLSPDKFTFEILIPFVIEKGDLGFAFKLCKDVLRNKLFIKETLLQGVVDALAKASKIKAAKELVHLASKHRRHSYKLKLPSNE